MTVLNVHITEASREDPCLLSTCKFVLCIKILNLASVVSQMNLVDSFYPVLKVHFNIIIPPIRTSSKSSLSVMLSECFTDLISCFRWVNPTLLSDFLLWPNIICKISVLFDVLWHSNRVKQIYLNKTSVSWKERRNEANFLGHKTKNKFCVKNRRTSC